MRAIAGFTVRRARLVMALAVAITVVSMLGLLRLRVDTNHINFFSERHELYTSAKVMDTRLSGIYTFQIFLEGAPDAMQQPDVLKRMDRFWILARRAAGHDQRQGVIGRVFATTAVIGASAFTFWLVFIGGLGSSLAPR